MQRVYPAKEDPVRKAYQDALRKILVSDPECAEKNHSCNADELESDITNVKVLGKDRFRFDVTLSPMGMGERAEQEMPQQTNGYVATRVAGVWHLWPERSQAPIVVKMVPSSDRTQ
jgi:hypothetical protein